MFLTKTCSSLMKQINTSTMSLKHLQTSSRIMHVFAWLQQSEVATRKRLRRCCWPDWVSRFSIMHCQMQRIKYLQWVVSKKLTLVTVKPYMNTLKGRDVRRLYLSTPHLNYKITSSIETRLSIISMPQMSITKCWGTLMNLIMVSSKSLSLRIKQQQCED